MSTATSSSSSKQEQLAAQIAALQAQLQEEKKKDEKKRKALLAGKNVAFPNPLNAMIDVIMLSRRSRIGGGFQLGRR